MPRPSNPRRSISGFNRKYSLLATLAASLLAPALSRADLYVVDSDAVDRFNSTTGAIVQTARQNTFTTLSQATGITVGPDGLVYVGSTDASVGVVDSFNATTGTQVGNPFIPYANGPSQISNIQGLAFGPDGNFYAADEGDNGPVISFNSTGGYLKTIATQGGNAEAVAFNPADASSGFIATGSTIEKFNLATANDNILIQGSSDTFNDSADLAFGPNGKLYVLDTFSGDPRILQYNADGTGQTVFADFNSAEFASEIFQPSDMAFGPNGDLYVTGTNDEADSSLQGEILQISSDGSSYKDFVTGLNAPGFLTFTPVPEPASLAILATGSLFMLSRPKNGAAPK